MPKRPQKARLTLYPRGSYYERLVNPDTVRLPDGREIPANPLKREIGMVLHGQPIAVTDAIKRSGEAEDRHQSKIDTEVAERNNPVQPPLQLPNREISRRVGVSAADDT